MSHASTVKRNFLNKREQSWQSSNVKLFGEQRKRETAKPLQFLELMKATFDFGRNTRQ
jgi:hypothetical protein